MNHEHFQEKQKRILSSFNLEKGGEGSRGGHVIGHTKTNKPIYESHIGHNYGSYRSSDHDSAAQIAHEKGHEDLAKFHENESKKLKEFESKQGSSSFNMFKKMTDQELRSAYKKYESLRGKKNKTHDEWTLTDHIADLKFEIDHRGGF